MERYYRIDMMLDDRVPDAAPPSNDVNDFIVGMMRWFGDVEFKGWWRDEAGALWRRFEFPKLVRDESDMGGDEYREIVDALGSLARMRGEPGLVCVDLKAADPSEMRRGQAAEFSLAYYELSPDGPPHRVSPDSVPSMFPNENVRNRSFAEFSLRHR